jgi:1,4-dihydroxy-2-naphthoate octaprenyltransferase
MTAPAASAPPTSSVIRPALGLLAGLGITALVVGPGIIVATLAMLRGVNPSTFRPSTANLAVYLAITAVGAFAGGFTTARITTGRSFYTVFLLALILFVSAMVPVLRGADPAALRPQWFLVAQAVLVLAGALLGGWLERRRQAAR